MLEAWAGQVFEFDSASCKHVSQFHLACSMAKRHHKKSAYQATRDEIDLEGPAFCRSFTGAGKMPSAASIC